VAACVIIEAVTRLIPGVMGNDESAASESFEGGLLEAPHYTRPAEFEGHVVPEVLRSGDHARIARWRHAQALHRTMATRPDLIAQRGGLNDSEKRLLEEFPGLPYPESSL
jgi:tRNA (guanine37-N1)-methyltransferase